jgi:hypothetical protein
MTTTRMQRRRRNKSFEHALNISSILTQADNIIIYLESNISFLNLSLDQCTNNFHKCVILMNTVLLNIIHNSIMFNFAIDCYMACSCSSLYPSPLDVSFKIIFGLHWNIPSITMICFNHFSLI